MNERRDRGTAVIQSRLDIRDVATVVTCKTFGNPGTKATLVRMVFESMVDILVEQGIVKRITSPHEAMIILERKGLSFRGPDEMFGMKLTRALQRETLQEEGLNESYAGSSITKGQPTKTKIDPVDVEEAVRLFDAQEPPNLDNIKPDTEDE